MNKTITSLFAAALLAVSANGLAQSNDNEELKIAALEALVSAPPERALPIVQKVLSGNDSDEIKSRALFILSQIDEPEAQTLLADAARNNSGELQLQAIRMIGVSGEPGAMAVLSDIYASGDRRVKEAVLSAYLIADDDEAVYQIAVQTEDTEEFEAAVSMLGAMGATDRLQALRERGDMSEVLINAYAIAGDVGSLQAMATDTSNPEAQVHAIRGLGIAGGADASLVEIYRGATTAEVREAAREGLMMADYDEGVLQLFQESDDPSEKRELLELLVMMDSDAVWDIIDSTLE